MRVTFIALLSAAAVLIAQPSGPKRPVHIEGVVLDKDTRAPIPNAKVTLRATEFSDQMVHFSDAGGHVAFDTLEPKGAVMQGILVESSGYLTPRPVVAATIGSGVGGLFQLGDQTNIRLELFLEKTAELRGILIDGDSKKPIRNVTVRVLNRIYSRGEERFVRTGMDVVSKDDGSFLFASLPSGEYFLQVEDGPKMSIDPLAAGTELPRETPQGPLSYGLITWPGTNADNPQFGGTVLRSGASVDVGQISLHRQTLHNVIASLDSACSESDQVKVLINGASTNVDKQIPCGPFRLSNIPDGSFILRVHVTGGGYRSQPIDLLSKNPISLTLNQRVHIAGTFELEDTAADAYPANLNGLAVSLTPKSMSRYQEDLIMQPPMPGKFDGYVYAGESYAIELFQLPEQYYLKKVFYDGTELPDYRRMVAAAYAAEQSLRIVLSKHPAALQAQVENKSGATTKFTVVLTPDGLDSLRRIAESISIRANDQSIAMKRGLRPGQYHAFAISSDAASSLERPGVMDTYLLNATAITLSEDQALSISLSPL